jgi:hypothetical protein
MIENQKEDTIVCPNCKMEGPKTMYCLNCGYPLFQQELESSPQEEKEEVSIEVEAEPPMVEEASNQTEESPTTELGEEATAVADESSAEPTVAETNEEQPEVVEVEEEAAPEPSEIVDEPSGFVPEPAVKQVMEDLKKSISLKLWIVDLIQEEKVKEDHFRRMFDGYVARTDQCMSRRNEVLRRARDVNDLEKALNEARVGLGELEIRRSIGDAPDDEYQAKAPSFRWDIKNYESEIARRRGEIAFLEDLTHVMTEEEISRMREMADKTVGGLDKLASSGRVSQETFSKVKESLEETVESLKELRCID